MKDIQDTWAKKAKNEGYRSRASYKLIQINQTHNLIEQADLIIELGSAPGGWSQVISNKKKTHTKCLAIDILSMEKINSIDSNVQSSDSFLLHSLTLLSNPFSS